MSDDVRYSIEDLARLADVSRRTVRYYVQEGLIPAPLGVGRGRHYEKRHLDRLLQVRDLQASGRTLDEIRSTSQSATSLKSSRGKPTAPERSVWRRLQLAPGLELHVSGDRSLPSPGFLGELAALCRLHFAPLSDE